MYASGPPRTTLLSDPVETKEIKALLRRKYSEEYAQSFGLE
jgi:hypothetical protein